MTTKSQQFQGEKKWKGENYQRISTGKCSRTGGSEQPRINMTWEPGKWIPNLEKEKGRPQDDGCTACQSRP